jgi:hypothetical protein
MSPANGAAAGEFGDKTAIEIDKLRYALIRMAAKDHWPNHTDCLINKLIAITGLDSQWPMRI